MVAPLHAAPPGRPLRNNCVVKLLIWSDGLLVIFVFQYKQARERYGEHCACYNLMRSAGQVFDMCLVALDLLVTDRESLGILMHLPGLQHPVWG